MPAQTLPVILDGGGESLSDWWRHSERTVRQELLAHGAVLLRGFAVDTVERFEAARALLLSRPGAYVEGATPRKQLGAHVYTSTEFPASEAIALHNENSYALSWPGLLLFGCLKEPETGGATPVADVRRVLDRMGPALVEEFERRGGWLLRRTYSDWFGLGWKRAFGTEDRGEVDAYCRGAEVVTDWLPDGALRTRQVRPVTVRHPLTGEPAWFNHVHFWHASALGPETRELLEEEYGPEGLPYSTHYGDGTPIPDDVVARIVDAFRAETAARPWRRGDLMLVDNMLAAHGREPFTGTRQVVVAMGDPVSRAVVV
ncbi:TauD/TfdA family dioxygenase [Streptomyces sp. NPDC049687]|uniref:TauD/TfdA family dioxygenase n=1 Tax=Streptomyces sp. NPDC049687 TaxID=3365596 RepID=UPI00379AB511